MWGADFFPQLAMRVLGSPSRELKASKSWADSQPNSLRDGEAGGGGWTHKPAVPM